MMTCCLNTNEIHEMSNVVNTSNYRQMKDVKQFQQNEKTCGIMIINTINKYQMTLK